MTKQILPLLLVLGFTACDERQPSMQERTASSVSNNSLTPMIEEEVVYVKALKAVEKKTYIHTPIPMLNDEVVSAESETFKEHKLPTPVSALDTKSSTSKNQTFTGGTITDGLDIGTIRLGLSEGKTRLVFDSYKWDTNIKKPTAKAKTSGHYTFKYNALTKRITAVVSGYRGFSALNATKPRFFSTSSIVDKIYLETYLDDSGYKFTIQLQQNAHINVFELKEPARIIVDITPN